MLSSHLRQVLPSCLFPYGMSTRIVYAFLIFPMRDTFVSPLTLLDLRVFIVIEFFQQELFASTNNSILMQLLCFRRLSIDLDDG
jgi:hypothetical protein